MVPVGSIRSSGAYRVRVIASNGTVTRTGVWRDFEVALVATTPTVITSATSSTDGADESGPTMSTLTRPET